VESCKVGRVGVIHHRGLEQVAFFRFKKKRGDSWSSPGGIIASIMLEYFIGVISGGQ
jgi:hypothetical protein